MPLTMSTTKVLEEILEAYKAGKRRILMEGGTSSTKTYSALQAFVLLAQGDKTPTISSIVSESLPHLKKGAIRDFFAILKEPMKNNPNYNQTDCIYTFPQSGSIIEFFGANESGKVHGPRRHRLFVNEGNNIPWVTIHALDIRTILFTIVDWNPVSEFWAHERWIPKSDVNAYSHSTYLDALHVLPQSVIDNIESNKDDKNWWHVYGLGLVGKIEGLVYPNFSQILALPTVGEVFYGLDFGFTIDPTTLIKIVMYGWSVSFQQLIFERGMDNHQIAARMEELGIVKHYDQIFADSAEPKSISEIADYGFNIQGAPKGPGSVKHRIQYRNQFKQFWTMDSVESIKEQRNCRFITDKDGKLTDKITHQWTHAMDACDYGMVGYMTEPAVTEDEVELGEDVLISIV